ncbi:hypothetical protein JHK82_031681 [Glycine max]|nr:hypothetical protein JHK85_032340 [Glycine max]KAG4994947.1 hypothetical protein JHK86_031774 [Glycine max]KAG5124944.1 hypothetical protein JHK82_031681 [Glycine max]KAG5146374.1 hypothetical protein JHK84_031917 [Glycine max]
MEYPSLSNLAKEVLRQMKRVEDNVQYFAAAERFGPLISRLHDGPQSRMLVMFEHVFCPSISYKVLFDEQDSSYELKSLAASTIANIVSKPGHWELASADKKGNPIQSEIIVLRLLGLLNSLHSQCQVMFLRILCGIASSPQASVDFTTSIPEFNLQMSLDSNKLKFLKEKLLNNQSTSDERSDAAQILANLSLSEGEIQTLLGGEFVELTAFKDYTSKPKVKRLAAIGLKNISEFGSSVTARDFKPPSSSGFCSSLVLVCGKASSQPSTCPIHNCMCDKDSQLCLLKSNCIKPLVDILHDNDTDVQLAAVDALSTLVLDYTSRSFKRVVEELKHLGAIDLLSLFLQKLDLSSFRRRQFG